MCSFLITRCSKQCKVGNNILWRLITQQFMAHVRPIILISVHVMVVTINSNFGLDN